MLAMSYNLVGQVLAESQARGHARMVLTVLAWHADDNGRECFPSTSRIARMAGLARSTVALALRDLETDGYIVDDGWHGKPGSGRQTRRWTIVTCPNLGHVRISGGSDAGPHVSEPRTAPVRESDTSSQGTVIDLSVEREENARERATPPSELAVEVASILRERESPLVIDENALDLSLRSEPNVDADTARAAAAAVLAWALGDSPPNSKDAATLLRSELRRRPKRAPSKSTKKDLRAVIEREAQLAVELMPVLVESYGREPTAAELQYQIDQHLMTEGLKEQTAMFKRAQAHDPLHGRLLGAHEATA